MSPLEPVGIVFDWSYPLACLWGLLIIVSLAGWGRFAGRFLVPGWENEGTKWALSSAWGMAIFLVLSGPMLMLSIFSTTFVALFVLIGLALATISCRVRGVKGLWRALPTVRSKILVALLLLLIVWTYAGAVGAHQYNPYDDFAAYFSLVKMMLDTGTLFDPFNFRLVGALGGQTALTTLVLGFFPWKYAHLMDVGICGLIMWVLVQEGVPANRPRSWWARVLLVTLALTFPVPRANIAGELSGTVLFMALFISFDLVATRRVSGWRAALLLGALIAAGATLRAHYIFVLALLGACFVAWRLWEERQNRREIMRETLMTVLVTIALLIPWWVVAYRSCGVFLYPLVKGTNRPEFELFDHQHLSFLNTLKYIMTFLLTFYYLPLFLPVFLLRKGQQQRLLCIFGVAILLISVAFLSQLTFSVPFDLYRYLVPVGLAFCLYTSSVVAQQIVDGAPNGNARYPELWAKIAVTVVMTAITVSSFNYLCSTVANTTRIRRAIDAQFPMWGKSTVAQLYVDTNQAEQNYREAFSRIPAGAKTLVALDYPYLLNYRSHSIFSVDTCGAASPAPGMPYFHGAAPVMQYLLGQGIHYLAYVPFDHSYFLYSRASTAYNLSCDVEIYRYLATYDLDFFNNVDELAKSNHIVFDSPTIRVITLDN